jgi:hypothetical protein
MGRKSCPAHVRLDDLKIVDEATEEAEPMRSPRAQLKEPAASLDRREFISVAGFAVLAQGANLTTTKALLHQHRIVLTQRELRNVNQGGTVIQRASSHVFVIALAKGTVQ